MQTNELFHAKKPIFAYKLSDFREKEKQGLYLIDSEGKF